MNLRFVTFLALSARSFSCPFVCLGLLPKRKRQQGQHQYSRSVHAIDVPDVLLQVFPDLREFTTGSTDHVELADDPPSTKVEADESDDSDLYALLEVEKVWVRIVSGFAAGEQITEMEPMRTFLSD